MKKLITASLAAFLSFGAFADCRTQIQNTLSKHEERNSEVNFNTTGIAILGGIVLAAGAAPIAITLGGLAGVGASGHYIQRSNLRGLKLAIDQAYEYLETGIAGNKLKRLERKINRKQDEIIDTEQLVEAIISANEDSSLCKVKNMNQFAKSYVVLID